MQRQITSLTDLAMGTPATSHEPLYHATGGWKTVAGRVFDVRAFGAIGDGITDDSAAILAALNGCGAAGGGEVFIPPGNWLCNTLQTVSGFSTILDLKYSNVWMHGTGAASRLFSTVAATRFLLVNGNCAGGQAFSAYNTNDYQAQTVYPMSAVTAGDKTIQLTNIADAVHFAVGDYIYLRTGQLVGASTGEPDAEINRLTAVNLGTGVLTLESPTLKDYVQEYFIAGTLGQSARAVTANLAAFGISNIDAMTIESVKVSDLTLDMTNQSAFGVLCGGQCWGLTIENCVITGTDVSLALGDYRHGIVRNNKHYLTRGAATTPSAGIAAKGSADILCTGNLALSPLYPVNWQANEGTANLIFSDNTTISAPASGSGNGPFTASSRPRNLIVTNNRFVNGGTGAVINIQPGSDVAATGIGGAVTGNVIVGKTFTTAIGIACQNFLLDKNLILPASDIDNYETISYAFGSGVAVDRKILWAWMTSATQLVTLGRTPIGAYPTAVHLYVSTAFDSDGTDQIEIGTAGTPNLFLALTDVSTVGLKTVTCSTVGYRTTSLTVIGTYLNGGSEPNHGRALVGLEYMVVPARPAEGA